MKLTIRFLLFLLVTHLSPVFSIQNQLVSADTFVVAAVLKKFKELEQPSYVVQCLDGSFACVPLAVPLLAHPVVSAIFVSGAAAYVGTSFLLEFLQDRRAHRAENEARRRREEEQERVRKEQEQSKSSISSSPNPNSPDDDPEKKESDANRKEEQRKKTEPTFKTNAEATKAAKKLGFEKTKEYSHGQPIYKNKTYL